MPVTPFHFGAGLAAKAVAPHRFGLLAFCAANVLIDIEPLYYALTRQYPLHRFWHTFVGAAIIGLLTTLLFFWLAWIRQKLRVNLRWLNAEFHPTAIGLGGLSGAFSHVLLDSLVHEDMAPFAPFSSENPFLGVLYPIPLEILLALIGFVSILLIVLRFILRPRTI